MLDTWFNNLCFRDKLIAIGFREKRNCSYKECLELDEKELVVTSDILPDVQIVNTPKGEVEFATYPNTITEDLLQNVWDKYPKQYKLLVHTLMTTNQDNTLLDYENYLHIYYTIDAPF